VTRLRARLRRLGCERGFSLMELMTVLTILSTVVTALTGLFVSGTASEVDLRSRVQAQTEAVTALDRLRRDVHCASAATASSATSVTLAVPCVAGGVVSWCTAAVAGFTGRYTIHRRPTSGTCDSTSALYADYLTTGSVFSYELASINNLARLRTSLPVKLKSMLSPYTLCDILVMRNSTRTGSPGTPVPAC
jgi:prepilin-type N-terminal cleavage/methylation domain-containing protein